MSFVKYPIHVLIILLFSFTFILVTNSQYNNTLDVFGNGFYKLNWTINDMAQTINMTLDVNTTGWAGIGFSKDGSMINSEVIMCYYSKLKSKAICQDSYASAYAEPPSIISLGGVSSITNVTGMIQNNRTIVSFTRNLKATNSRYNLDIQKGQIANIIFAFRKNGNPDIENGHFGIHNGWASKKVLLYPGAVTKLRNAIAVQSFHMAGSNYSVKIAFEQYMIPPSTTSTICKYIDLNQKIARITALSDFTTYHAILLEPLVNSRYINHMEILGCNNLNTTPIDGYFPCDTNPTECNILTWAWSPGVGKVNFPKEAGIVWGTYDTSKIILKINYVNERLTNGIIDSSGVNVHFTTKLRKFDAGMMLIGKYPESIVIPPQMNEYNVTGICDQSCTSKLKGNIQIFSYQFYGHSSLRKISSEFLKPDGSSDFTLASNNFFYRNQKYNFLSKPFEVNPGFKVTTVCTYNSQSTPNSIVGGQGADQEMCLNYLQYYPRENGVNGCFDDETSQCQNNDILSRVIADL